MGSEQNKFRRKWQAYGGAKALVAENAFWNSFKTVFQETEYEIRSRPRDLESIYVNFPLDPLEQSAIYNPDIPILRHGVIPDFAIKNTNTSKMIYVEVKRQDGWVEDGKRSDGRGNAHERSCKYFTPGLLRALRERSGIPEPALPFWTVFQGNITRDPCRVREITCWYEGYREHLFFWREAPAPERLFEHFDEHIAPLLDAV